MKYIAYGSNMSVEQMRYRCPHSSLIGTGVLDGYQLEFYLHATVEPASGAYAPVAVWEIDPADEASLDMYEGYPNYYTKDTVKVRMNDGSEIEGMIYIMNLIRHMLPIRGYYLGILDAYNALGLTRDVHLLKEALKRCVDREQVA